MKKKLLTALLATTLTFTIFSPSVFAEVNEKKPIYSTQEQAKMQMYNTNGDENLETIGFHNNHLLFYYGPNKLDYNFESLIGDPNNPNDDNSRLLFGETNREYAKIGNEIYNLQDYFSKNTILSEYDRYTTSTATIGDVVITRRIDFVTTTTTFENALQVSYNIENKGTTPQDVSIKLFWDIYLRNNDLAPFNIPGKDNFSTERSFTGSDVPGYWFAYDNLENPSVITRGNFVQGSVPTKVDFLNWAFHEEVTEWDYAIDQSRSIGDSAVAMYWDNNIVAPGESTTIDTNYGLESLNSTATGQLVSSLLGGENVVISPNEHGQYSDYSANAVMENKGNGFLENLKATINIPQEFAEFMSLPSNDSGVRTLGRLQPSFGTNATWNLSFTDSYVDRDMYYTVTLSADGVEPVTLRQNVKVKANLKSDVDLTLNGGSIVDINANANNKYDNYAIDALVKNISTNPLQDLAVTVSIPDEFKNVISLVEANATNNIDTLAAGATSNEKWNLKISDSYEDRVAYYYVTVKVPGVDKDLVVKQRLNITGLTKPEEPVTPPTPEEPKPETKPTGSLPYTGAEYPNALPIAGTVLTLLGVALLRNKK